MSKLEIVRQLALILGSHIEDLSFAIQLADRLLEPKDFDLQMSMECDGRVSVSGWKDPYLFHWEFVPEHGGWRVSLSVSSSQPFECRRLDSMVFTFSPGENMDDWWIPTLGSSVESVGMIHPEQLTENLGEHPIQGSPGALKYATGSLLRGAFPGSQQPGILLGTYLPQNFQHSYSAERLNSKRLRFSASTNFLTVPQQSRPKSYTSEATWVCTTKPIQQALAAYAQHLPRQNKLTPARGWNSWDYYFSALRLEDMIENMEAIQMDANLARLVQTVVVDMGWEHCWGEWQANYRFPGGLERLANEIQSRGFIPGIWTAPLVVHPLSYPGLRNGDLFIKNEYGDPWLSPEGDQYAVDPTSPAGQEFLREIFTRL